MDFKIGDEVLVNRPGSWTHQKIGYIKQLNYLSSDGIYGCLIKVENSVTVIPPSELELT